MQRVEPEVVWRTDFAMLTFLMVALMVLVAVGIGLHVYFRGRQGEPVQTVASRLMSSVWLLPVVVLCGVLASRAAPSLFGAWPEQPHNEPRVETTELIHAEADGEPALNLPDAVREWPGAHLTEAMDPAADANVFVLSSRQYATVDEAEREVLERAEQAIANLFDREYGNHGRWAIPPRLLEDAIRRRHVEPITHTTGTVDFEVYRLHAQAVIDSPLREKLHEAWRNQISQRRLWTLGGLLGFATLLVGSCAAYLRLDMLTQGEYRRRLKFAALALITAGGLAAARMMAV